MRLVPTRRRFLQGSVLLTLGSTAGCLTAATSGTEDTPTAAEDGDTGSPTEEAATVDNCPTNEGGPEVEATELDEPDSLEEWLSDANRYTGEVRRYGPNDRPTINVGDPTESGFAFDPPVIEVPPHSEVTWAWTGHGVHNVVALDGAFDSGRTNEQRGTAYRHFFEDPGEYLFVSEPHYDEGMKGAVVVREPPSTGNEAVDEWLVGSSNFDGTVVDKTDASTATIRVGAAGNKGHFAFDPPVLKVSTDTTVVWEWTGDGGGHNVVFQELSLGSGKPAPEPDSTFEHTFEVEGTYRYACEPHRALGMKGAIIVE